MELREFNISNQSDITAKYLVANYRNQFTNILVVELHGTAKNSSGKSPFRHMMALISLGKVASDCVAVILDLTNLKYVYGDEMVHVLDFCTQHPFFPLESIPVSVITSDLNRQGMISLITDEMSKKTEDWLYDDMNAAWESMVSQFNRLERYRP